MELKKGLRYAFVFLAPVLAALAGGLKDEWAFLIFSALSLAFFIYERQEFEPENPWFMYFAWLVFSSLFSQSPLLSLFTAFKWLVFYLFYSYFRKNGSEELRKIFIYSLLTVSFVCAALLFREYGVTWPYSFGVIGKNRNYTSIFLMLSSAYFFYSYFKNSGRLRGFLRLAGSAFFLFPVIMLNSRGALIFLLFSYAVILLVFKKKRFLLYSLALAAVAILPLPRSFLENFLKLDEAGSYMRPYLWSSALSGALAHPLSGYGPGLFESVFELFKFRHFDGISYFNHTTLHAHSELLNIAAESGFIGAFLFLFAFYKTLVSKNSGPDSVLFKIFAGALFMQGMLDVVFYLPLTGLVFMTLCGLAESPPPGQEEDKAENRSPNRFGLYLAAALSAAAVFPYFHYRHELKSSRSEGARVPFFSAFEKNPSDLELLRKATDTARPNSPRIAAVSSLAGLYYPSDVYFLYEGARCSLLGGDARESEELLKRALFLEPGFKRARLLLAELYLAGGDAVRAKKNLKIFRNPLPARAGDKQTFYNAYILDFDSNIYKNLEKRLRPVRETRAKGLGKTDEARDEI